MLATEDNGGTQRLPQNDVTTLTKTPVMCRRMIFANVLRSHIQVASDALISISDTVL